MTDEITSESAAEIVETKRKPPKMELDLGEGGVLKVEVSGDFSRIEAATGNRHVSSGLLSQMSIMRCA